MKQATILTAFPEGTAIPRILHQTYRTKVLPSELQSNVDALRAMNPEYEYRFYDDAAMLDFIERNYPQEIVELFNRINPKYGAARADLFRYLLIYKCGGVYLDIKSSLLRPLREIIQPADRYLLSQWRNAAGERYAGWGIVDELRMVPGGEFQQWHIVAVPGHPFLKAVIEQVLENIGNYHPLFHGVGWRAVMSVTGPHAYTLTIAPLLPLHPHRFGESDAALGLEYSIYRGPNLLYHGALLGKHYSRLTEPLIRDSTYLPDIVFAVREKVRRLRKKVRMALERGSAPR